MRTVFAGTPEFAASHLRALLAGGQHDVVGVYTQPDRRAGRGKKLTPSPVKQLACEHDIPVFQPNSLRDADAPVALTNLSPEVMVVVAYGLILPAEILEVPTYGCLNVHASLLPRWRGAAPVQRAVAAGDTETGVTIMQMDAGLDTGAILNQASFTLSPRDTSASVFEAMAQLGPTLLLQTLDKLASGDIVSRVQDENLATYAHKIDKSEGELDWSLPAPALDQLIRALNPAPGCYTWLGPDRLKIWLAEPTADTGAPGEIIHASARELVVAAGEGALAILNAQFPGAKSLPIGELMNARKDLFTPGVQLGAQPAATPESSP